MYLSAWVYRIPLSMLLLLSQTGVSGDADPLGAAARRFRLQVYESFRTTRPELDQRLQTADAVLQGWRDRGAPDDELPQLVDWFQRATQASQLPKIGSLPPYASPEPARGASDAAGDSPTADAASDTGRDQNPKYSRQPALSRPTHPALRGVPSPSIADATSDADPAERPDVLPPIHDDDLIPQRPRLARRPTTERLPLIRLRSPAPNAASVDYRPPAPASATVLDDYQDHYQDHDRRPPPAQRSEVDLHVLAAKIRWVNLSFTAIDSELQSQPAWTVDQLEAVAGRLSQLISSADLVRLYYRAIPSTQRGLIEPIVDTGPTEALLAQRVFEARLRLTENFTDDNPDSIRAQLVRLERIAEVMEQWKTD
jgi:hypothetical protein